MMTALELFAGIGGIGLGLERAGMTVVGQVEIDPFCRRVLARHWPEVPRHDDVRTAAEWWRSESRPRVDLVAGGFPCQPFSDAGRRRGISDERWMWPAMAAVIRELGPRYVLVENVAALIRDRAAFGWLLGDLAKLGFDAEWSVLSACAMGAPHTRERLFLVAYPDGAGPSRRAGKAGGRPGQTRWVEPQRLGGIFAGHRPTSRGHWASEPDVGRVAHGVPARVDRLRVLGNAVVPQVAEHIGRLILRAHNALDGEANRG